MEKQLSDLSEDVVFNLVGYFNFSTRLSHGRINRKFNSATNYWWKLEKSFPFLSSYYKQEMCQQEKMEDQSALGKNSIASVKRYNFKLIPAVIKCRQLTELNLIFAHTPFFHASNRMLSKLGSKMAEDCLQIQSISLLNGNLSIVSDYLNGQKEENELNFLDVRCSQNEEIDLDQFVNLIKTLALYGTKLDKLSINLPVGKSQSFNPIKKYLETVGGRLVQLWSPKFYLFRPKEKLVVLGIDQLIYAKIGTSMSKIAIDCPNIHSVIGYVHPSQSNIDAIKCWNNLTELHLSNFKSGPDYERFRVFLMSHGNKLKILRLKDLLEVSSRFWPSIRIHCLHLEQLALKHVYSIQNSSDELSYEISQMKSLQKLQLSYINPSFNPVQIFTMLRSKILTSIIVYGHQELLELWTKEINSFNMSVIPLKRKEISLTGIVLS